MELGLVNLAMIMKKVCFYPQKWLRESIHRFRLQESKMGTTDQEEKLLAHLHWAVTDIIIASKGTNYATVTQLLHSNLFGFILIDCILKTL